MAQAAAATATVRTIKRDVPFAWEGRDKKGARIKGKSLAPDEVSHFANCLAVFFSSCDARRVGESATEELGELAAKSDFLEVEINFIASIIIKMRAVFTVVFHILH